MFKVKLFQNNCERKFIILQVSSTYTFPVSSTQISENKIFDRFSLYRFIILFNS